MARSVCISILLLTAFAAESFAGDAATSPTLSLPPPGEVREITANGYKKLIANHQHDLLVVNFWATWCVPCVIEIPHFVKASETFKERRVQFVGVSLDFLDERKARVEPFLKEHKVPYPNFILNADQNTFLKSFPEDWTGALPATFLYDRHGTLLAHTLKAMTGEELDQLIEANLKQVSPPSP